MAKEIIKEIKGFEDYYISNYGVTYTTKISSRYNPKGEMRVLKARNHPSGYQYIGLFRGKGPSKQRIWKRVHRVVYETFVGKIKKGFEIDHISGNKHQNELTNLRLVTHSQNMIAAFERRKLNKTK
jgi:hypothetical protein